MALSTEQTKVLIELVASSFSFIASEKNRLYSLIDSEYCNGAIHKENTRQLINDGCHKKMVAYLTFNELAAVLPVDEEFINEMHSDSFNIILECIDKNILMLRKHWNNIEGIKTSVSPESFKLIKIDFDKKITQLEDIKHNMNSMFSYF